MYKIVLIVLCISRLTLSDGDTYKAAVITTEDVSQYNSIIQKAAHSNVDILLLSNPKLYKSEYEPQSYDQLLKSISEAAKEASIYVVAHLLTKTQCQNKDEILRTNIGFDRKGAVISIYRKPLSGNIFCNMTTGIASLTTDFGVTFGVLMEEDLALQNFEGFDLKNFVLAGRTESVIPFLAANQFSSSWAFVNSANLISTSGIFAGVEGPKHKHGDVMFATLKKDGGFGADPPLSNPGVMSTTFDENLNQYIIKPLNIEASIKGYTELICHTGFCCEFQIQTKIVGPVTEVTYGLAVFNGNRVFNKYHSINIQTCAVFACAGPYKRTCDRSSNANVNFEMLSITSNYTKKYSVQYPIVSSSGMPTNFDFRSQKLLNTININFKMSNVSQLWSFGVIGRNFAKDYELGSTDDSVVENVFDGIFDYVSIKMRILIVVVSIYILEMM